MAIGRDLLLAKDKLMMPAEVGHGLLVGVGLVGIARHPRLHGEDGGGVGQRRIIHYGDDAPVGLPGSLCGRGCESVCARAGHCFERLNLVARLNAAMEIVGQLEGGSAFVRG